MRTINTIQEEEFIKRLSEAMRRMYKKIIRLSDEENSLSTTADNKGDEEKALRHAFNGFALDWAAQAILVSPERLKERLAQINRGEFIPAVKEGKISVTKGIIYCERCGLEYRHPLSPEVIPFEKIDGKLYCPNCVEWDEETKSYKPKEKELL